VAGGPGPGCCPPPPCASPAQPGSLPTLPGQPGQPGANADVSQPPTTDAFAQAPPTGAEGALTALPNMIGDLGFYGLSGNSSGLSASLTPSQSQAVSLLQSGTVAPSFFLNGGNPFGLTPAQLAIINAAANREGSISSAAFNAFDRSVAAQLLGQSSGSSGRVPVTGFGSFKISDNGTVAPQDRVFITYNYYDVDGLHGTDLAIHREVIGFEKSFLDGDASFGLRVPYSQVTGDVGSSDIGDLSMIFKYAFYRDRETGNVISGGLVVTVPTGPDLLLPTGNTIDPTLLQPFIGYAFNFDRFFVEGFCEIIVPTDSSLSTFIANDISFGYRCQNAPIIPVLELHVNDPFNHRGSGSDPTGFADSVILTAGVHTIFEHSSLTIGVTTPVTGPNLYSVEAVVQYNWRF
jgi:hypothetical protein